MGNKIFFLLFVFLLPACGKQFLNLQNISIEVKADNLKRHRVGKYHLQLLKLDGLIQGMVDASKEAKKDAMYQFLLKHSSNGNLELFETYYPDAGRNTRVKLDKIEKSEILRFAGIVKSKDMKSNRTGEKLFHLENLDGNGIMEIETVFDGDPLILMKYDLEKAILIELGISWDAE